MNISTTTRGVHIRYTLTPGQNGPTVTHVAIEPTYPPLDVNMLTHATRYLTDVSRHPDHHIRHTGPHRHRLPRHPHTWTEADWQYVHDLIATAPPTGPATARQLLTNVQHLTPATASRVIRESRERWPNLPAPTRGPTPTPR